MCRAVCVSHFLTSYLQLLLWSRAPTLVLWRLHIPDSEELSLRRRRTHTRRQLSHNQLLLSYHLILHHRLRSRATHHQWRAHHLWLHLTLHHRLLHLLWLHLWALHHLLSLWVHHWHLLHLWLYLHLTHLLLHLYLTHLLLHRRSSHRRANHRLLHLWLHTHHSLLLHHYRSLREMWRRVIGRWNRSVGTLSRHVVSYKLWLWRLVHVVLLHMWRGMVGTNLLLHISTAECDSRDEALCLWVERMSVEAPWDWVLRLWILWIDGRWELPIWIWNRSTRSCVRCTWSILLEELLITRRTPSTDMLSRWTLLHRRAVVRLGGRKWTLGLIWDAQSLRILLWNGTACLLLAHLWHLRHVTSHWWCGVALWLSICCDAWELLLKHWCRLPWSELLWVGWVYWSVCGSDIEWLRVVAVLAASLWLLGLSRH